MSLFKNVNVVSLEVNDYEAAKKFYRDLLDWPVVNSDDGMGWEEYGVADQAHVSISRSRSGQAQSVQGGTTLVLTVDNATAAVAALRAKGIKCDDVMLIPGVVAISTFYDPFGNRVQFVSESEAQGK
jgi:predicted enzyme related to lactoylglutathione lyase